MLLVCRSCHEEPSRAPDWFDFQGDGAQDRWVSAHSLCSETWQVPASCRRQDKEHTVDSRMPKQEPSISLPLRYQKGAGPKNRANDIPWVVPSIAGLYCRPEATQHVNMHICRTPKCSVIRGGWDLGCSVNSNCALSWGTKAVREDTEMASLSCLINWVNYLLKNRPRGFFSKAVIMIQFLKSFIPNKWQDCTVLWTALRIVWNMKSGSSRRILFWIKFSI